VKHHDSYQVALTAVDFVQPSEEVDARNVDELVRRIGAQGVWTDPIPIDRDSGIIMDGNHRARAAALLQLKRVPCVLLSYEDPRIRVDHWKTGESFDIRTIFQTIVKHRKTLPYKTTRHSFFPALPKTAVPLETLRSGGDPE